MDFSIKGIRIARSQIFIGNSIYKRKGFSCLKILASICFVYCGCMKYRRFTGRHGLVVIIDICVNSDSLSSLRQRFKRNHSFASQKFTRNLEHNIDRARITLGLEICGCSKYIAISIFQLTSICAVSILQMQRSCDRVILSDFQTVVLHSISQIHHSAHRLVLLFGRICQGGMYTRECNRLLGIKTIHVSSNANQFTGIIGTIQFFKYNYIQTAELRSVGIERYAE